MDLRKQLDKFQIKGKLIVIHGTMFTGKSTKLLELYNEAKLDKNKKVGLYKPAIDTRFDENKIITHDKKYSVDVDYRIPEAGMRHFFKNCIVNDFTDIFIDESNFFKSSGSRSKNIVFSLFCLLIRGVNITLAGLTKDFQNKDFGATKYLLENADEVIELQIKCQLCNKNTAFHNQRLIEDSSTVLVGDKNIYQARCSFCYEPPESEIIIKK